MTGVTAPLISVQDNVTIIALLGAEYESLDDSVLDGIQIALMDAAQQSNPPLLVLDLAQTRFFGSAFVKVLFQVGSRLKHRNGSFAICNLNEHCAEVVHITHLDSLWPVVASLEEAVAKLKAIPVAS
jgi:anti-anti-sigma factor